AEIETGSEVGAEDAGAGHAAIVIAIEQAGAEQAAIVEQAALTIATGGLDIGRGVAVAAEQAAIAELDVGDVVGVVAVAAEAGIDERRITGPARVHIGKIAVAATAAAEVTERVADAAEQAAIGAA